MKSMHAAALPTCQHIHPSALKAPGHLPGGHHHEGLGECVGPLTRVSHVEAAQVIPGQVQGVHPKQAQQLKDGGDVHHPVHGNYVCAAHAEVQDKCDPFSVPRVL